VVERGDAVQRHIDAVLANRYLDVERIRARHFRVALDCINGAGGVMLPLVLERLGCEVLGINLPPTGRFHRAPEPVAENLAELEAQVRATGADVGMATDPDADRLALVDELGRAIGEDYTLAFAVRLVLAHRPGPVVTNLSTSRLLDDVCAAAGAPLQRAPVGEINVARRMQAAGAVIGGEGNGGVILPDVHLTRDSAVAAALVLQLMVETGDPVSRLVAARPSYVIVKDKLPRDAGELAAAFATLERELGAPEVDRQDGLRLAWPRQARWLHLRASGTEPILRIIAEGPTAGDARALVDRARQALAAGR
jgi:phosphomannomutase